MGAAAAVAGIGAVGAIGGALISSSAASSAADTQSAAAKYAADLQLQQYHETTANLSPFRMAGVGAVNILSSLYGGPTAQIQGGGGGNALSSGGGATLGGGTLPAGWRLIPAQPGEAPDGERSTLQATPEFVVDQDGNTVSPTQLALTLAQMGGSGQSGGGGGSSLPSAASGAPTSFSYNPADYGLGNGVFNPTQAALEATPGYQFTRDQGLKSVQNSAAARGLGVSGAALKGAARFATGLADQTLNTQANIFGNNVARTQGIFQSNLNNYLNPLMYLSNLGENAAATAGQQGVTAVGNAGQALIGGANAQAAGQIGSANAISGGLNSVASAPLNYQLYNRLLGSGGGGGGGYVDTNTTF